MITDTRMEGDVDTPSVTLAGPGTWQRRTHVENVWGTAVTFDIRGESFPENFDDILADAIAYLHQVDAWFSTYRVDTPITMYRNGLMPLSRTPTSPASLERPYALRGAGGCCGVNGMLPLPSNT